MITTSDIPLVVLVGILALTMLAIALLPKGG